MKVGDKVKVVRLKNYKITDLNPFRSVIKNRQLGAVGVVSFINFGYARDSAEVIHDSGKTALYLFEELKKIKKGKNMLEKMKKQRLIIFLVGGHLRAWDSSVIKKHSVSGGVEVFNALGEALAAIKHMVNQGTTFDGYGLPFNGHGYEFQIVDVDTLKLILTVEFSCHWAYGRGYLYYHGKLHYLDKDDKQK